MRKSVQTHNSTTLSFIILLLLLSGCNFPSSPNDTPTVSKDRSTPQDVKTMQTFRVKLAQPIPVGESIFFSILDEVTGLEFNQQKYIMNAENPTTYTVTLPFGLGSVIKYRYSREGIGIVYEKSYSGKPVRYRMCHVEGSGSIEDIISRWMDTEYVGEPGQIKGHVIDSATKRPISNILVLTGSEQAFSSADGSFYIDGLSPGTYNMVFYSMDGSYSIYQQGAMVEGYSTTPVEVQLKTTSLVTVIFAITVPSNTPIDAPIRLAGSLYQLGNTFTDLPGGVSTLAARMPLLGRLPDGRYLTTLNLPAGTYLEYKYTLGDGLWSSEMTKDGLFELRHLVVPDVSVAVNDNIEKWQIANYNPIRFEVKVPIDTPQNETISIQFNPGFGWVEPLPMQAGTNPQGDSIWRFNLTGPFNNLQQLNYRYCRQEQCGIADDLATIGPDPEGRTLNPSSKPGIINDQILDWAWFDNPNQSAIITDLQVEPRDNNFVTGIAFQPDYSPSWGPKLDNAILNVSNLKINWLLLSPTWTFTNNSFPTLEPVYSQDMSWFDLTRTINFAKTQGLQVGLYPVPHFPLEVDAWWRNAFRDYGWWVSFFEEYSNFILHHATIASDANASSLVLGGEWINPALPGGTLLDGSASNVPQEAETRWRRLIQQVRERYSGKIIWAVQYPEEVNNPPPFLDVVDQIYILWSAPIALQQNASVEEMKAQTELIFNRDILPLQQQFGKPVIIAISYPSVSIGAMGCIPILGGGCLDYDYLKRPNPDVIALRLDLMNQANAYNAVLSAINHTSWISGFVSMGYYPPAVVLDKSISINGKPASGVIWFWSQKFLSR